MNSSKIKQPMEITIRYKFEDEESARIFIRNNSPTKSFNTLRYVRTKLKGRQYLRHYCMVETLKPFLYENHSFKSNSK